ncbi:MAG: UDP-N-acetylglucosamine--peptide N-acetylglucosaminyltransferase GtfA subunit [Eubacterium sp.]|uniref:glycosyltransferase family 4 protein n=1 Tax=Eubacterium sp. TaxID=142586 RepID=UPI0030527E03
MKKKVLIVAGGYLPGKNYGGPVTSLVNFVELLKNDYEIFIVTSDHDLKDNKRFETIQYGWNTCNGAKVLYLADKEKTLNYLKKVALIVHPDLIYCNSIFDYKFTIPFVKIAHSMKKPLLLAARGEMQPNALKTKSWKKKPYLCFFKKMLHYPEIYFQGSSDDERKNIQNVLEIEAQKCFTLSNIPNIKFLSQNTNYEDKRDKILRIITVSRVHPIKNLLYSLELLKKIDFNVQFDIYGPIEEEIYWKKCQQVISTLNSNISVTYKGYLDAEEKFKAYDNHDVFLFPTITENFGHVISEAMSSGCPVIISDNTPWNWINEKKCGYALPLEDDDAYLKALYSIKEMDKEKYAHLRCQCQSETRTFLAIDRLKEDYITVFDKIMIEEK